MADIIIDKVVDIIVTEGYKRYEKASGSDKNLVRKIYSVWMEVGLGLGKIMKDSQED
jgi:hypothetical protein